jgi:hypothetical protein
MTEGEFVPVVLATGRYVWTGLCAWCDRRVSIKVDGKLYDHKDAPSGGEWCSGAGLRPATGSELKEWREQR